MTFAAQVIRYNRELTYTGLPLPPGIRVMNPYRENSLAVELSEAFYRKYYNDDRPRHLILGINPGRFGAGLTGVPFTDPKRLESVCGLHYPGKPTHEPSSVFVYAVIAAYGGPERFYGDFFINSLSPLGFVSVNEAGKEKNYNYYDSPALLTATRDYIISNIKKVKSLGVYPQHCFCLGTGRNETIFRQLNATHAFFDDITALEHPRFVVQYKQKAFQQYVYKYVQALRTVSGN